MSAQSQIPEYRKLHVNLISADGLKNVKLFSKMDVYVEASIMGYPRSTQRSTVDKNCGTHPRWSKNGKPMEFMVDEPYLTKPGLSLRFNVKARSSLGPDKDVGYVTVPVHELFDNSQQERVVEYQVVTPSGKRKGSLKFAYRFGDKLQMPQQQQQPKVQKDEPVTAYPAYPPNQTSPYQQQPPYNYPPPQQQGYGYPPPQSGYAYPPPQAGYGYPGYGYPQQPPKRNNRMGMGSGMGLGLGAGLLGGLLIGDMVSDVGEASAYADGYGDAMGDMDMGGFDF